MLALGDLLWCPVVRVLYLQNLLVVWITVPTCLQSTSLKCLGHPPLMWGDAKVGKVQPLAHTHTHTHTHLCIMYACKVLIQQIQVSTGEFVTRIDDLGGENYCVNGRERGQRSSRSGPKLWKGQ